MQMSREGIPKLLARRISSFALLPRTQHYIALSYPIKECVAVGPLHNVLAQSPLVWGVVAAVQQGHSPRR